MTDDSEDTEWEEWNAEVTFTWTYVNEGPFPVDMPDDERRKQVEAQFWRDVWDEFYHAYTGATPETQLDLADPEKYNHD